MGRPKKYHTTEEKLRAIQDKSQCYYAKREISARRKLSYQPQSSRRDRDKQEAFRTAPQTTSPSQIRNANRSAAHQPVPSSTSKFTTRLKKIRNTSQYEVTPIPVTIPMPAPPPDPFPKFDAEALTVLQEFEDFLVGKAPSDYVKSLLCRYFKDNSRRQGEIGLFVEPLDDLYEMQKAYESISAKALQTDGPSERQKKLESAGEKIGQLISWLECWKYRGECV
ncbi:uncharacterized protein EV420DRAFT_1698898 [Desarmillaria tabescens]|uniref:Uncharacterized protein n=1 Tax=Armillaria tabescens TaxID=1929756 RepID=A0AA39NJR0_ARMTA|nr:uncharacterized protein EV420DRAFT_1698898 [Desarmillaria tabescens]KAK0466896.1 hypothetical protein EV420DRAFT_1698898 [Desarmillaria tabescens]